MDLFLIIISSLLIILGMAGSFMPILPGPLTSWFGLFIFNLIPTAEIESPILVITFIIAIIIFILDNLIPIYGSKYFGATKYGIIGASIGLVVGILSPIPFGILIGPIFGALIGGKAAQQAANYNAALMEKWITGEEILVIKGSD